MNLDIRRLKLPDLRKNERVVTIAWHHWWVLFREVIGLLLLFIAPFILIPFAIVFISSQGLPVPSVEGAAVFFGALWALIVWQILFTRWTDYYFDVWIVTNWRIIDIDQKGLFRRNISSILDLDHIQDIDTEVEGIIRTILDFGNIEVQTAGAKNEFIFDEVAKPRAIERLIRDAQAELLRIKQAEGHISKGIE